MYSHALINSPHVRARLYACPLVCKNIFIIASARDPISHEKNEAIRARLREEEEEKEEEERNTRARVQFTAVHLATHNSIGGSAH